MNDETRTMDQALQQAFEIAVACHQGGRLQEAEHLYRAILRVMPQHAESNHNLGLLAAQAQQPAAGLSYFNAALEASPETERYWLSYIDALIQAGETASARLLLARGLEHGLSGEAVEALAMRLAAEKTDPKSQELNELAALSTQGYCSEEVARQDMAAHVQQASAPDALAQTKPGVASLAELLGAAKAVVKRDKPVKKEKSRQRPSISRDSLPQSERNQLATLFRAGSYTALEIKARLLVKKYPQSGFAWSGLGSSLQMQGKEALHALQKAAELLPDDAQAQNNLGIVLVDLGRLDDAMASYRRALALKPDYAEAHYNLGIVLADLGRLDGALASYRQALALKPDDAQAHSNLGNVLKDLGRFDDALASCRQALALKPDDAQVHNNLGIVLKDLGRFDDAMASYRRALALKTDYAEAHYNLGIVLTDLGRLDDALASYRRALAFDPDNADVLHNLGLALQDQGRLEEALALLRHALKLKPGHLAAQASLLFCTNYHPDLSAQEVFKEYQDYDTRTGVPLRSAWLPHNNDKNPTRRLKVGYVSPDFREHSARNFLEPLLTWHDKSEVDVYGYAELTKEDDVTIRYRSYLDHWIPTRGMSNEALAQRIRDDGIDILVDLAGHTAGNRLSVFAQKPAPVSLSWMGFGYTTGLSAIDYYLTDDVCAPLGSEALFAEQPWRLEKPSFTYQPQAGMGDVGTLPAQQRGYVTFGTLTRSIRINHRTIRVWSDILKVVPDSRLVIDSHNFRDLLMQERMAARFAEHGIARGRLEIGFHSPPWDVMRGIDIGLDCFPHNSGTTLFETLYMGRPYITLAGRPSVGRLGSSILQTLGHPEWIAQSEDEYIEKAVKLAGDWDRLAGAHSQLRAEIDSSPIRDEKGFARKLERAYRQMWQRWCAAV